MDSHAHVFARGLKLAGARRYAPSYDADLAMYLHECDAVNISHGVLVQPSFLGTDNSYLLDALRAQPKRLRGIAVVEPSASDATLTTLNASGIVGLRLNLIGARIPDLAAPSWRELLGHLATMDWQVELHTEARNLKALLPALLLAGVNVVVDHFGRPDPGLGVRDPGFKYLLAMASTGRVWVKLSGAYRNGTNGIGEATAVAAMPLLCDSFGVRRLLWGSDWPHTQFEETAGFAQSRTLLDIWLTNPAERHAVLSETPRQLFRFGDSQTTSEAAPEAKANF